MPLEIVLLVPQIMTLEDQREFGELLNPPLVVKEEHQGGTLSFSEFDGTLVLTLARPKVIEVLEDVRRVLGATSPGSAVVVPDDSRYWIEGIIPFNGYERGLAVVLAFETALDGAVTVRGV